MSDEIQKLIDENPNRTLHFGDGVYLLKKTILTAAEPEKSVDLKPDTYAVFAADEGFAGGPLVAPGGKDAANNVRVPGSNYGFTGGILDGRGIADGIHTGVKLLRGGNTLRNVHPLYYMGEEYESSTGFVDDHGNNFYSYCYSDRFATGRLIRNGGASVLTDCVAFRYTGRGGVETALRAEKQYNALVHNMKIGFSQETVNTVLSEGEAGGRGRITNLISDVSRFGSNETWKKYFDGTIVG